MYNLYAEKDAMLEEYYRTGIFPHEMFPPASTSKATSPNATDRAPKALYHDPKKFLLLHLFFITSLALFVYCVYTVLVRLNLW